MILYRLRRRPSEDASEGEDWNEWFSSLREAKKRRAEVIAEERALVEDGDVLPRLDLSIERVTLVDLPKKQLLLRCLNRFRYIKEIEVVVPEYKWPNA